MEAIGGSTPYTDTFGYNADDLPLTQSVPGTVTNNIGYDGANRLTTTTWTGPTAVTAPLSSTYGYGYNAANWTTALTSTLNGVTTTQTITHDAQGRLTAASSGGSGGTSQSWSYDGNGNLLTAAITTTGGTTTTSYSYASAQPNELLQLTTSGQAPVYYGYDQNGDTTSITNGAAISTSLQYDSQARPITITQADGTQISLGYNDAGQRSSYRVSKGGSTSLAETFQYRDGLLGQAVITTTATYTDTYLYTQSGAPLELIRKQANGSISRYWYVLDGRGSVVALTDSSGKVVDRYGYDLWGNPTSVSESVPQQLRYAGYWWDAALGWYWVSVRYYDPALERWVQPDPSQIEGVHTYAYVGDDPVDATDPTGFGPCDDAISPNASPGEECSGGDIGGTPGEGPSAGGDPHAGGGYYDDPHNETRRSVDQNNEDEAQKAESRLRTGIRNILSRIRSLAPKEVATRLVQLGLRESGSPDGRFMHFRDTEGRMRARIDPPDRVTHYAHLHLYDERGEALDADLQVVPTNSSAAHIRIGP